MSTQKLLIKCGRCNGTGIDNNPEIPETCLSCGGSGLQESGLIDVTEMMNELDWLKKKIKKILQKLEIPEE